MSDAGAVLALGLVLGVRHATDADHVIAVSTIVTRHHGLRGAALVGVAWGLGHTLTVLLVGGGIIAFGWIIPPRVGLSFEFAVAVMLVALGVANLRGLRRGAHGPVHRHGDYVHRHPAGPEPGAHPHPPDATPVARLDRWLGGLAPYRWLRPVAVGMVHGLAGSAVVALVVLPAVRAPGWGIVYLLLFGAGTIAGMMAITLALAWPFAGRTSPRLAERLRVATGLLSLAFGCFLAVRVGIVEGLFV